MMQEDSYKITIDKKIFESDPFAHLDQSGVGQLTCKDGSCNLVVVLVQILN